MTFSITDAVRGDAPLSFYVEGESGAGKTFSSLLLARGLAGDGGKIGVIDTEGRRALIYADNPEIGGFRHMDFTPPYSPDRCIEAFKAAVADGWQVIVFDSASLEHDGEGGLLEMADEEETRLYEKNPNNRGISQQKWTRPKLAHKRFLNYAVGIPAHVIFCFRQTLTTDFSAKPPASILTTVAEKNTKFALDFHLSIGSDHRAKWTRLPEPFKDCVKDGLAVGVGTGRRLAEGTGAPKPERNLKAEVAAMIADAGISEGAFNSAIARIYNGKFSKWDELPTEHLKRLTTDEGFSNVYDLAADLAT